MELNSIDVLPQHTEEANYTLDIQFYDEEDECYKVKIWTPNTSNNHDFVKALWLNEARQLNKLKTANNASKYIEIIHDYFVKDGSFYLVYKSNHSYKSLHEVIKTKVRLSFLNSNKHWLHTDNLSKPVNRVYFWKNILRLVNGIEILHNHGIIHRNINMHSIIYDGSDDYENDEKFILAGFEKSLDFNKPKWVEIDKDKNVIYTTHQDWHDLSSFILEILGVEDVQLSTSKLSNKEKKVVRELHKGVSQREVRKGILSVSSLKLLIESCIDSHSVIVEKRDSPLHISIAKSSTEKVFESVRDLLSIPRASIEEIKNILEEDLDVYPFKIYNNTRNNSDSNRIVYLLQGRQFTYKIREFKDDKYPFKSMMVLEDIVNSHEGLASRLAKNNSEKVYRSLKYINSPYNLEPKYRSEENSWNEVLEKLKKQIVYKSYELECLQGLLMSIAVEQSLMSIQKYRVQLNKVDKAFIKKNHKFFNDTNKLYFFVSLVDSDNKTNNNLSKAIGYRRASDRFIKSFKEEGNVGDNWIAILDQNVKNNITDDFISLQFHTKVGKQYIFAESEENKNKHQIYENQIFLLYPSDITGTDFQIERRIQVFRNLLKNMPLTKSLSRPYDSLHVTSRTYDIDYITSLFDESKRQIFKPLISTYPNYFIEGPPGVGKTFLITKYVNHIVSQEDSAKILLSAQAHATVDLLHKNTLKALQKLDLLKDMVIISDFKDENELQIKKTNKITGVKNLDENSEKISKKYEVIKPFLDDFQKSPLFKKYYKETGISDRLKVFSNNAEYGFFNAIIKAANLVFTTSNSALMASLVNNEVSFDVSIMEESAKASGIEMVGAMLIANKRVMIGDSRQLPAFSEGVIESILQNASYKDVKIILNQLNDTNLNNHELDQLGMNPKDADDSDNQQYANELLGNLQRYFPLFKSLCEDARDASKYYNFGGMLNIQHRMHPDICNIISKTVYDDQLITDSDRINESKQNHFVFDEQQTRLEGLNKENAVIWVDIPDIKTHSTLRPLEKMNQNMKEVEIIHELEKAIRHVDGEAYSLKVLSPYSKQVKKLNHEIKEGIAHTVDSFQGNEADVVIISLVRHNVNPTIRQALGFLVEMRRMNVLLSRAKHKLIIVGCFGLFKTWLDNEKDKRKKSHGVLSEDNFKFLDKFVALLDPDYLTMLDNSCSVSVKDFKNINFVSAKKYVGL